jgi:hypothetical protein
MSISECVALSEALEEHERAAAKERRAGGLKQNRSEESAERSGKGDTRDKVAAAVGLSHDTLSKARQVVEAAEDEGLPVEVRTVAKQAVEEMDRTGKVAGAHRAVAEAKGASESLDAKERKAEFRFVRDKLADAADAFSRVCVDSDEASAFLDAVDTAKKALIFYMRNKE